MMMIGAMAGDIIGSVHEANPTCDRLACIAGGIAEVFYGFVDSKIVVKTRSVLPG